VTNGRTGSDTVVWVKIASVTNNAAETGEAANTTDGDSSGRKPESAMTYEQESTTVKTIAHWLPVTTRALQDALQLRSYIDQFLRYGVEERVEDQILNGGGTGEDLTGILNTTDILEQVFTTDLFISTRKARTKVRVEGRSRATAYVMHPNDVETLDLSREATGSGANTGAFFYGGPQGMNGRRTLWGLPVVESEAIAEGTALLGDFKQAMLWDKMESSISVSNSHNDFFIRNLVAILAETRLAFAVIRPQAFCSVEVQDPS
jgi:HK97 family phage major capsid protein